VRRPIRHRAAGFRFAGSVHGGGDATGGDIRDIPNFTDVQPAIQFNDRLL